MLFASSSSRDFSSISLPSPPATFSRKSRLGLYLPLSRREIFDFLVPTFSASLFMISGIGLLVHWQKLSHMITLEYMSTIYKGVRGRICRNIITPDRKLQHSFGRCERSRGWHRNGSHKKSVPESQIFPVWRAGDIIRVWTFWKKLQEDLAGRLR